MGLYQVLLLFATVSVSHFAHCKGISSDSEPIHMSPPDAPFSAFRQQNRGTTRFLRTGEEERQISAGNVVGMVASAINNEGQLGLYLSLGLKPETVKKLLKVKKPEGKRFRSYSKYFYRFYVKYLGAPLSHLPASTVDNIMNARLHSFLAGPLTPPQVKNLIGDGKYLQRYYEMYSDVQVRMSKRINGFSAETLRLNGRDRTVHTRIEA
ncbi:hypothetical protein PHYSODRAFT_284399 [Phytophthora sojae]|uniref:RxLR effector protein n=1 Tax=Phytophthora sojae (strain P6497) TaxID=1094619 RepID=G4YMT2_PHYSP|nr:hypothetical protein PHYSODRAFT_284399 [Phytophthora sojae]EGZ29278.1 hypothetical protein PHYSODRAFT_284399 [Phytophthora sojae]|eukprot:XP_009516553.1 hypothetical protein PHYSODRAFT_284399 [Phytophthora sojae]